jgi:Integrase core domain
MSQVRTGPGRLNAQFGDFASHYGFDIKTHRPYRPRTKGKVERMVDYVKKNFLNGKDFAGSDDLNSQALAWLSTVANVRIHGTTGQKPNDLWLQEKDQLLSLDQARPYVPVVRTDRKVASDTFVSFDKNRYSVPPKFIGKTIEIIAQGGVIKIRCEDAIIAEHVQSTSSGQTIMKHEHMEELWKSTLDMVPLRGVPHCNVQMDEAVKVCSLSSYDEVCI